MNFRKSLIAAAFLIAGAGTLHAGSTSIKGGGDSGDLGDTIFPAVSCNVEQEMLSSRDRLLNTHGDFDIQGVWPWPDVTGRFNINGVWYNSLQGAYVVIHQHKTPESPSYGVLTIDIYSACDNKLLASGARRLKRSDWEEPKTVIYLGDHLFGDRTLFTEVEVVYNSREDRFEGIQVKIIEVRERAVIRDLFKADRLL